MAQSVRQRNLFAAEDFTVVYDSFKQANFQAYDYDTIKETMVDYVRNNYPENFNDWIQSSEFVSLIELMSFLGHNLAFRNDLAARENFLSTAERRASVIRIADFLNYNPVRNTAANGVLKIQSIKTTQNVYNVNGQSLKNTEVRFVNDQNTTSYQDFLLILNEMLGSQNKFGKPTGSGTIDGVASEIYQTTSVENTDIALKFTAKVNGTTQAFEVVNSDILDGNTLIEPSPEPGRNLNLIYKNDNQGIGSANTGFFVQFKQGTLTYSDYNADSAITSLLLDLNSTNVNNNDVWVQNVDTTGAVINNWTKIDSTTGTNAIYNAFNDNRNLFSVKTLDNDNVAIQFGDGIFADIPRGVLRVWYRNSLNLTYVLNPDDVGSVKFVFDYTAADGNVYRATMSAELEESVTNASSRETVTSIKENAGRVFATQDRMITNEDYNIYPLTAGENIRKIKSVNRTHSGHSRFIDINDPTATYQNVNMITDDGYLYSNSVIDRQSLSVPTTLTTNQIFEKYISDVIYNPEVMNMFYQNYDVINVTSTFYFNQVNKNSKSSTGYITDSSGVIQKAGLAASTLLSNVKVGSIVEFIEPPYVDGAIGEVGDFLQVLSGGSGYNDNFPPQITITGNGYNADAEAIVQNGQIVAVRITNGGAGYTNPVTVTVGGSGAGAIIRATAQPTKRVWARVTRLYQDGLGVDDLSGNPLGLDTKGNGAVALSKVISNNAKLTRIFPAYNTKFDNNETNNIIQALSAGNPFGVRFDSDQGKWKVILEKDLPTTINTDIDLTYAGNTSSNNLDDSWIIHVSFPQNKMLFRYRKFRIVFGSENNIQFFNQNDSYKFNSETNKPERDRIRIFGTNSDPVTGLYPIGEDTNFFAYKYFSTTDGYTDDRKVIVTLSDLNNDLYPDNPLAFQNIVGSSQIGLGSVTEDGFSYTVYDPDVTPSVTGRANIDFQWRRVAELTNRIDPAITNIVDVFVLTQNYDTQYRDWIVNDRSSKNKPLSPSSDELSMQFANLDSKKSMSDSIIYRSAKYKSLFGSTADENLQAKFRVIKVAGTSLSDSQIKSRVLTAINEFFNIDNWDFGETFYFTELAAYVHNQLLGIVSSIAIVPTEENSAFGNLFQVTPNTDELFIPDADLNDIEIVDNFTGTNLRSQI